MKKEARPPTIGKLRWTVPRESIKGAVSRESIKGAVSRESTKGTVSQESCHAGYVHVMVACLSPKPPKDGRTEKIGCYLPWPRGSKMATDCY